jgi:hypothetical protein
MMTVVLTNIVDEPCTSDVVTVIALPLVGISFVCDVNALCVDVITVVTEATTAAHSAADMDSLH